MFSLVFSSTAGIGFIKNIAVPGWGFENKTQSKQHFLREIIIWTALLSAKGSATMFEDYYSSYGIDYANTDIPNYDFQYSMDIGNYNSMSFLIAGQLRYFFPLINRTSDVNIFLNDSFELVNSLNRSSVFVL